MLKQKWLNTKPFGTKRAEYYKKQIKITEFKTQCHKKSAYTMPLLKAPTAKRWVPPSSRLNWLPLLPLPPTRILSNWHPATMTLHQQPSCYPGSSPPRRNVCVLNYCYLNNCVTAFWSWSHTGTKLAVRTISFFRSCEYFASMPLQSYQLDAAVGQPLDLSTAQVSQDEYLMTRITFTPDVVDDMMIIMSSRWRPCCWRIKTTSTGHTCESGQGQKRATAIVVARLLKIQPGIHRLKIPPPDRSVARVLQLYI